MIDSEIFQPEILLIFISFSLVMAYYFGRERHVGPYWACFFAVFLPVMGFLVIFLSGNIKKRKSKPSKFKSLLGAISGSVGFLSLILLGLFSINKPSFFSENFIAFFPAIGLLLLGGYLRKRGRGISMNKFYINENNTNLSRHNELRFQGKADGFVSTLTYYSSLIICVLYFAGSEIGLLLFNAFPNSEVGRFVLKSVIFIDKNHYGANLNLGTTYNYTDDHEKAIDYFDRSIERSPKRSEPYYWRGDSKYFLNLYEEALIDLDIAIEKGYANKYSYCKRGNVNEKLKKTEEAIEDFNSAIAYDRDYFYAYTDRARVKWYLDPSGSFADLDFAILLDKDTSYLYNFYLRGFFKFMSGEFESALSDFNVAVEKNTTDARVYFYRGMIKHRFDNLTGACEDWYIGKEMGNSFSEISFSRYCENYVFREFLNDE